MERSAPTTVADLGRRAKAASRPLATASTAAKDEALRAAADLLEQRSSDVLAANAADLEAAAAGGMEAGPVDRLRLTEARLSAMAAGLRKVAALPDPVGEVLDGWRRPNGLEISRVRVPLGVVAIIYENRPNVTSDAGGLCLKSGNAALLRGSSTALRSNQAVTAILREGAAKAGLPEDSVLLVDDVSHEAAVELMQLTGYVDCLIPRGGPSLVRSILDHAKVPYVIDGDGNCHVYVDAAADLDRALDIVLNAKTQRPGSPTARSSASGPRSASRPRSSTPGARWRCGSSPPTSTSCGETGRSGASLFKQPDIRSAPSKGGTSRMAERFVSVDAVQD